MTKKDQKINNKSTKVDSRDISFEEVVKRLIRTPPKKQSEIKSIKKKKEAEK
jgi:hypothetical protein